MADTRVPGLDAVTSALPWLVDDLPIAVLGFAGESLVAVNRKWVALTGLGLEESKDRGWLSAVHGDDWAVARAFADGTSSGDRVAEWRVITPEGRHAVWVQATSRRLHSSPGQSFVIALSEIDTHKANEAGLLHRATHDPLTGLLNREVFLSRTADAVDRAVAEFGLCAVLYLDLDCFKHINDEYGHQAGDNVLAAVGRRIRSSLRPTDIAARLGGDEIGVLCPTLDSEAEASRLAQRIVQTIGQPFTIDHRVVSISVSVGVAFSSAGGLAAIALLDEADRAMYRAKSAGRAQWATVDGPHGVRSDNPVPARVERATLTDVLGRITAAQHKVDDMLSGVDLRESAYARLAQARQALRRANALLGGDDHIG